MAQAGNQSFPTDRLNGTNPLGPNEQDERGEQDLRREHGGYDDRSEQDLRREQDQRRGHDGRRTMVGESGGDRRQRSTDRIGPATSTSSGDVFGPVLAA